MVDEDIKELMEDWSVGDCASVVNYIYSLPGTELTVIYAVKMALAIQALGPDTNQADVNHFLDLLED